MAFIIFYMILPPETIIIGEQEWMSTNLNTSSFRNGTPIYHAVNEEEWEYASKNHLPAFCHYENNDSLGLIFGKLYNYYAVIDENGLAPANFKIPSVTDWSGLASHYGGLMAAGTHIKSIDCWEVGTSDNQVMQELCLFNGYPGGLRYPLGYFDLANSNGFWWTMTNYDLVNAMGINLYYDDAMVLKRHYGKGNGFSVRCLKSTILF
jgi:uncharacterized protein (TIGR02145 family)